MSASPGSAQQITYQIIIEAENAINALRQMQTTGKSFDETMAALQNHIQETAKRTEVSWETVLAIFKQVQIEMAKGGDAIFHVTEGEEKTVAAAINSLFAGAKQNMKDAEQGAFGFVNVMNLVKMALGEIQAILVYQLYQAIVKTFQDAIKQAHEYYEAVQNITTAQQALAGQGVDISNQELLNMVKQLREEWRIFSTVEMTQTVSQAALLGAQYKLSADQIQRLSEMAATLAALHGGMPADYVDNLLKAASGTNALWANQQGIAITSEEILNKAKQLNLVSQDTKTITDEQVKITAGLALENERLGSQTQRALENQDSMLGVGQKAAADYADSVALLGKQLTVVETILKGMGSILINQLVGAFASVEAVGLHFIATMVAGYKYMDDALHGHIMTAKEYAATVAQIEQALTSGIAGFLNTGGINMQNAPVNPNPPAGTEQPTVSTSELDGILKDYQSYYDSMVKAKEDFDLRMQNMSDQYNLRVQNEQENTNLRIQQEQENFHLKQQQEEQNFQQKMKDLKNRYLLDLEDALRKRDAEAVIKIIEKYNLEKTTAEQQEKLKQSQDAAQENLKIQQMREDEQLRLKQMKEEYDLQQKQAQAAYANQQADLARALDTKLQEEAVKIGQEHGLNQTGIEKLYELFKQYYGPGGDFASLQQGSYVEMLGQTEGFVAQMQAIMAQYGAVMNSAFASAATYTSEGHLTPLENTTTSDGGLAPMTPTGSNAPRRFSAGGSMLATSATTAQFGEAGPELALFLPMNSSGNAQQQALRGGGLGSLFGGNATVRIELGSDLEGRIINNALNQAAISIEKVYRSRA